MQLHILSLRQLRAWLIKGKGARFPAQNDVFMF